MNSKRRIKKLKIKRIKEELEEAKEIVREKR